MMGTTRFFLSMDTTRFFLSIDTTRFVLLIVVGCVRSGPTSHDRHNAFFLLVDITRFFLSIDSIAHVPDQNTAVSCRGDRVPDMVGKCVESALLRMS